MPDKDGKPDDRTWIYDQVLAYVVTRSLYERTTRRPAIRRDMEIYSQFAPSHPGGFPERPSWGRKRRPVKRAMIASAIRRLIADGKIRLHSEEELNLKSMHGGDIRNRNHRKHTMGKEYDGLRRSYIGTNVLEALVDALEAS